MSLQRDFKEVAAQLDAEDAEAHAIVGQCGPVAGEVTAALGLSRDNFTLERASRALALCGSRDAAALVRELGDRFPDATLTMQLARAGDGSDHRPRPAAIRHARSSSSSRWAAASTLPARSSFRPIFEVRRIWR